MSILVTGGAGYIGSHTCVELLNTGYEVVVVDNFVNSSRESLKRVEEITQKKFKFYEVDCLDQRGLERVFRDNDIQAVIHFAGLKAVGESVYKPLEYYHNNITGTLVLLQVMEKFNCKKFVFSSSATVYGDPKSVPIKEDAPLGEITNPYGRTKGMLEQILTDLHTADPDFSVMLLRYFNPIGAHISGRIGEHPKGIPNNLLPYITQVAVGKLVCLGVFGKDYPTHDGTCVRDYIHVVDLADGHVLALKSILEREPDVRIYNLGTGTGYSVLDVIHAFEKANDLKINYVFKDRRLGDVPQCYADPGKAYKELGWKAVRSLEDMCKDSWRWQKNNPNGFEEPGDLSIRKKGDVLNT